MSAVGEIPANRVVLVSRWAGFAAYACHQATAERIERDFAYGLAGFVLSDMDGFESIRFLFVISIAIGAMRINNPRVVSSECRVRVLAIIKSHARSLFHHQSGREK